jgi:hypothetical protein
MPRATKNPIVYLALSPAATATALGIKASEVADAIDSDALPVFVKGVRRRILVSHIERWVLSWPQPAKRKPRKVSPANE